MEWGREGKMECKMGWENASIAWYASLVAPLELGKQETIILRMPTILIEKDKNSQCHQGQIKRTGVLL